MPGGRLLDIAFRDTKGPMTSEAPALQLAPPPVAHPADIDNSDPAYDFVRSMPDASAFAPPSGCSSDFFRSVFVDCKDYKGTHGFEEVCY